MNFKNNIALGILVGLLFIGCGSDISKVKDGFVDGYDSTTLGEAIDYYCNKNYENVKWNEFTTANGRKVVDVNCSNDIKNVSISNPNDFNNHASVYLYMQFMVNSKGDVDFEPSYCEYNYITSWNGIHQHIMKCNIYDQLDKIYNTN